jgi:hypothetical protein
VSRPSLQAPKTARIGAFKFHDLTRRISHTEFG